MENSRLLQRTLVVSVLVHLVLILLLPGLAEVPAATEQRIHVTLADARPPAVYAQPPEAARVDEAPPDAVNPALFAAQAQNPEPPLETNRAPRSLGDLAMFDFRPTDLLNAEARSQAGREAAAVPGAESQAVAPTDQARSGETSHEAPGTETTGAGDARLRGGADADQDHRADQPAGSQRATAGDADVGRRRPRHHDPVAGVTTSGALSLSTYAWEFAPYIEYLKERLSSRWKPPLAFYMGLVEGEGTIRFRILRDGTLAAADLIAGERQLDNGAALNAVDHSAPFRALPDAFPEPYLEITWTYKYIQARR